MGESIIVESAQPAWEMFLQVATALGTIGAAVYAGAAANAAAAATNLERQRREDERAAALIAELQIVRGMLYSEKTTISYFRLTNHGPHEASNIRLEFPSLKPRSLGKVPESLRPGQMIDVRYVHLPGAPNGDGAILYWTDGRAGEHSSRLPPGTIYSGSSTT